MQRTLLVSARCTSDAARVAGDVAAGHKGGLLTIAVDPAVPVGVLPTECHRLHHVQNLGDDCAPVDVDIWVRRSLAAGGWRDLAALAAQGWTVVVVVARRDADDTIVGLARRALPQVTVMWLGAEGADADCEGRSARRPGNQDG